MGATLALHCRLVAGANSVCCSCTCAALGFCRQSTTGKQGSSSCGAFLWMLLPLIQREKRRRQPAAHPPPESGWHEYQLSHLQVITLKELTGEERMPAPLWGTFCGVSNGMWIGTFAAYNPYTGADHWSAMQGSRAHAVASPAWLGSSVGLRHEPMLSFPWSTCSCCSACGAARMPAPAAPLSKTSCVRRPQFPSLLPAQA